MKVIWVMPVSLVPTHVENNESMIASRNEKCPTECVFDLMFPGFQDSQIIVKDPSFLIMKSRDGQWLTMSCRMWNKN